MKLFALTLLAPSTLAHSCTITQRLGCYQDGGDHPTASNPAVLAYEATSGTSGSPSNTKENCATMCKAHGYGDDDLIGVEYGVQCFCGHGFAVKQPQKKDDVNCNMQCAGNRSETCGGSYSLEVFKAKCAPPPPPPAPPPPAPPGQEKPCDILGAAGNPCVAAHSTVRALYGSYNGPLYKVTRPDGKSADIRVLKTGGFANKAAHDAFCNPGGVCVISIIYDQSELGNHLGQRHKLVNASRHPILVGDDVPVYGMWFDPGYGYHVDKTTGIATGNDPESIYAVMSGTHYNGGCCFDYGNSETDDTDDGCGTMEAIYFGNAHWAGNTGAGSTGPWVGADLEQGMYYGGGQQTKVNNQSKPLTSDFVSLNLKGREDGFTLKGGDATKGTFETMYDGPRPDAAIAGRCGGRNYQPMRKEGAIILATGGDQSNSAQGNFYEGFMATGYASDATDNAVQANIVAVGYKTIASTCKVTQQLGCYQDGGDSPTSSNPAILAYEATSGTGGSPSNTKEKCAAMCKVAGYGDDDLVGVEYGAQCFCGHGFAVKQPKKKDDANCNMKCAGDSSQTCGGSYSLEVFKATCAQQELPPSPTAAFTSVV